MAKGVAGGDVLTTGQAARVLRVAHRTMGKWVDAGLLPGSYRLPGSRDRRVPRASLEAFVREHGLPSEWLADLDAPPEAARVAD